MHLTLRRKTISAKSTIGELLVNNAFFCFTLEDIVRRGAKVYGQTAIPGGVYEIAITYSNRFRVMMPLLLNIPGFEGIRIHPGNTPENTSGCILVGRNRGTDWIGDSRLAYQALFAELQKARGKITIEILNPPGWDIETIPVPPASNPTAQPVSHGQANLSHTELNAPSLDSVNRNPQLEVRHETLNPNPTDYTAPVQRRETQVVPVQWVDAPNDEGTFTPASKYPPPQRSLGQRLGNWIDSMDTSRFIGALSFIATAATGIATQFGDVNPKYAALVLSISGTISVFCGRLQGATKDRQ